MLDSECGGFCRFGPARATLGQQYYLSGTAALVTRWSETRQDGYILELVDVMACPADERRGCGRDQRIILRRLQVRGAAVVRFEVRPRWGFANGPEEVRTTSEGAAFRFGAGRLALWASFAFRAETDAVVADLSLSAGDELWAVIGWNSPSGGWTCERAAAVFEMALQYWRDWSAGLKLDATDARVDNICRSAITVQLLTHAEHNSAMAALTTSLPERIGGDRNYDYRFAWVRDASLSLALLAQLGKVDEVEHYLDWLCSLGSVTKAPLQVCYRFDGKTQLEPVELSAVRGYLDSRPVRYGNRVAKQPPEARHRLTVSRRRTHDRRKDTARAADARQLRDHGGRVVEEHEGHVADDRVGACIVQRQRIGVRLHKRHVA